ncbi:MAG: hypothetical protein LW841_17310 [Flammeovirgaceae bacterium]|nr:hypothetical protein [Flammeovirgaceae bacterium]
MNLLLHKPPINKTEARGRARTERPSRACAAARRLAGGRGAAFVPFQP